MEFSFYKEELILECEEALDNLEKHLSKISLGTANPQMFSRLEFSYYDSPTMIGDVCSITHSEPQTLIIKPFDKQTVKDIYSTIVKQNFLVTIQDEGDKLRIIFPQLTTEKRKQTIKELSSIKEQAKIKVRQARQTILKKIKNDEELTEDMQKNFQNQIQNLIDEYTNKIDQIIKLKEEQLMKI